MLTLTAPHVKAISAYYFRKHELNNAVFKRCNNTLLKTLQDGKQLTRTMLRAALEHAKISADGLRLGYIMMNAELDGIICSGARLGKQFTYALLEERVPPVRTFSREEALSALTQRYFSSRGPATVQDFAYWSGLSMKDATPGVNMLPPDFSIEVIHGKSMSWC